MTIKVGTIHELTGEGYEVLVDVATRTEVLAHLYNGNFIREAVSAVSPDEATAVSAV